jgi:hypothetical protein
MGRQRRYSNEERDRAVALVRESGRTATDVAQELGINARTLARWVRADHIERRGQHWANRVRPHFDFLTGYGFALTDVVGEDWWKVAVIYRSARAAVEVALNFEYVRVDLTLLRLVDGELPGYPIFVVDSAPVHTFHADWLLRLRASPDEQPTKGVNDAEAQAQLVFWAAALREHGADFLAGDLSVLDQLEHLIRDNARRHGPPQVTVWTPADAGPDEATMERMRSATPEDVDITVRQYRRP